MGQIQPSVDALKLKAVRVSVENTCSGSLFHSLMVEGQKEWSGHQIFIVGQGFLGINYGIGGFQLSVSLQQGSGQQGHKIFCA